MLEREVKLSFLNADEARAAIIAAGALPLHPRRLQDDALFDTADERLRRQGCALRLRTESGRSLVTFKGPVQPGAVKIRDEHETTIGDREVMVRVFAGLALRPWFRYQKYREEFSAPGATIAIDETPVGTFVEIEGTEEAIATFARALDRTAADFILDSYYRLFQDRRAQFGIAGDHMVFAPE